MIQHFRVARPTNDLGRLLPFYRDGLGLTVIGSFEGHNGFDGVMLGMPDLGWHLELTREAGSVAPDAPSDEHLLVLYFATEPEWLAVVQRMSDHGFESVKPHNPYWESRSVTFADPDGYRVALFNGPWS